MVDLYKDIREASFRGFGFETPEDSVSFGRRVHRHEYPGKDEPFHEDSGQTVRAFSMTAIIRGADYYSRATAFERLLAQEGSGKLIHPYYGEMEVIVLSGRRSHSTARVGEILFSIEFEKFGDQAYPEPIADTALNITTAADLTFAAIGADFASRFVASGVPDFITNDAIARLDQFTSNVQSVMAISSFQPFIDWPTSWQLGNVTTLAASITDLYRTIAGAVQRKNIPVIGGVQAITNVLPAQVLSLVRSMISASEYSVGLTTTAKTKSQSIRHKNADTINLAQTTSALAAAGEAVRHAQYESREQAIVIRDLFAAKMDTLLNDLATSGWDASWAASQDLTAAVTRDINARIGRLPRTAQVKNNSLRPAMALANRLYGDTPEKLFTLSEDIAARNNVRHPGFVPADDLEVLL